MYGRRPDHLREIREECFFRELLTDRLGDAEVDHLDDLLVVVQRDHDVRRFQVAVDDSLLMSMLNRLADVDEKYQTLEDGE